MESGLESKVVLVTAKMSNKKLKSKIEECIKENWRFVIVCMDNSTQVDKIHKILVDVGYSGKLTFFHDEGDTLEKPGKSVSVEAWSRFFTFLSKSKIIHKRIFTTATPENIISSKGIQCNSVFVIPTKQTYTGYQDVLFVKAENLNATETQSEEDDLLKSLDHATHQIV